MFGPPIEMTEDDARGIVMRFTPEAPMFVSPRLYRDLVARGFLRDPDIALRVRVSQPLPPATK